jgi:hypothetical protein
MTQHEPQRSIAPDASMRWRCSACGDWIITVKGVDVHECETMTVKVEVIDAYRDIVKIAHKAVVDYHGLGDSNTVETLAEALIRLGRVER